MRFTLSVLWFFGVIFSMLSASFGFVSRSSNVAGCCPVTKAFIVSTGSIRWILWFSVRYAAAARRDFGVNTLGGKQQQLGSPNLQDIFIGG